MDIPSREQILATKHQVLNMTPGERYAFYVDKKLEALVLVLVEQGSLDKEEWDTYHAALQEAFIGIMNFPERPGLTIVD